MEKIASALKDSESKQRSLSRALEALQSQASSALLFSLQWKDLEDHFESTRAQIQTRFEELKTLEMKAKELEKVEELIDQGKRELGHLELLIEKKGCEVEERKRLVRDKDREISEGKKKLGSVRKKVTFEERELEMMQGMLEKCCEEIEAKRRELGLEDERFGVVKCGIVECERELRLKEEKMSLVEKSMEKCMEELDEKEKIVREMNEWKCKLEKKESELEGWAVGLALKEKQVKSKVKEVGLAEKRVLERLSEVEMKEKDFDEQRKAISEGRKHLDSLSSKLQMREWELCKQAKDLNLEKQKWESIERSTKECTEGPKSIEEPSVFHLETDITWDGRGLQLLMNEQLKRIDKMSSKMSAVFQGSSDPAKLVLDAVQGFHQPNPNKDNEEIDFDLEITRRSCIVLLKELKRISTPISPPVKEEAMNLATEWKSKLATENRMEILGFLQLVTTYELTSLYDANELQGLLAIIAQPKEANERQFLASEITITPPPVKDEEQESSLAKNAATSPILQPSSTVHERNLLEFQNEQMVWEHSLQSKIFVALKKSSNSDPAKLLLDLMQVSFAGYWMKEDVDFEPTAMESFISLLETVRRVQPHVGPQLKDNATNLAVQWKRKLRADDENSWEILGFLLFIATYDILFTFSTDDIAKLLVIISQHTPALKLCQTLVLADKLPDIILNLVQGKQLVEAVRLICTFKLSDKFPPAPLLHQFVEDSWNRCSEVCMKKIFLDEKDKVVDSQIADLRAVVQCINKYNLQSEYQPAVVEVQIDELKKLKENWRLSAQSLVSQIEPHEQSIEKKRSPSTPTLIFQPQQQPEYKDQLTAISAARPPPYPSPTCIPSYPQSHPSPVLQTNYGFPMPTNGQPCASSYGNGFMPTLKRPCMMNFGYQTPASVPFMPTMKRPCMMNAGYQAPAPAPVPSPAPTPAQMHSANYNVPCQFPHPNMLQFRGR
ncbi:FRIGIDA-like protein 5 [Argentina anserina]|uniref:FRIGIDA-like protein 5 n=1 Tax=Argentina anserina TaxID=57926 RepID=UPI0021764050|nr:FRIGIDA-like protein 5 [Potentilla anserina]